MWTGIGVSEETIKTTLPSKEWQEREYNRGYEDGIAGRPREHDGECYWTGWADGRDAQDQIGR
jgi:hypothetical protein